MLKTKVWTTLAVGSVAALALSAAAFAAPSQSASLSEAADHATAKVDLPATAGAVIAALVGGASPSTERAGNASTNATAKTKAAKTEATETEATETESLSHGQQVVQPGTAGTRPGFGCGDTNHVHTGPPGRPGATPPPGCDKH